VKVIIIGAGRIGTVMGYLLRKCGFKITGIYNRSIQSATKAVSIIGEGQAYNRTQLLDNLKEADLLMVTTPDNQIKEVIKMIGDVNLKSDCYLMHMSGLLTSDILKTDSKRMGVFSFHPLQSIASFTEGIKLLPKSVFTIEGDEKGREFARMLADKMGVKYCFLDKKYKPLYHAAAVVASNYLVTLVAASYSLLQEMDLDNFMIRKGIIELVKGTVNNIEEIGPEKALTGPIARGDTETIKAHQQAISEFASDYYQLYQLLGRHTSMLAGHQELVSLFSNSGGDGYE